MQKQSTILEALEAAIKGTKQLNLELTENHLEWKNVSDAIAALEGAHRLLSIEGIKPQYSTQKPQDPAPIQGGLTLSALDSLSGARTGDAPAGGREVKPRENDIGPAIGKVEPEQKQNADPPKPAPMPEKPAAQAGPKDNAHGSRPNEAQTPAIPKPFDFNAAKAEREAKAKCEQEAALRDKSKK